MKSTLKPTDINGLIGSTKFCHTIPQAVRESKWNGKTHNAENLYVFMVMDLDISPYSYVAIATDADEFPDEESIKNAHKLNTGDTGKQGSGLLSVAIKMASVSGNYNPNLCELITYSNGFVVSSTVSPKSEHISIFELNSVSRPDLVPIIEKILGIIDENGRRYNEDKGFKFENNRRVKVLHLYRFEGGQKITFPLGPKVLSACKEFCNLEGLNFKLCFRRDRFASQKRPIQKIFNKDPNVPSDFVHNRVSSGISVKDFLDLYSLTTICKEDMCFEYESTINGQRHKIIVTADCSVAIFPGLSFKHDDSEEDQEEEKSDRDSSLVSLRDVGRRGAGAKGGHDLIDSGHRIFVCFDSEENNKIVRPTGEPLFAVHDTCPARPSTYTISTFGFKVKESKPYKDIEDFIEKCKSFESKHQYFFNIKYDELISDKNNFEKYSRYPFMKIFINVKDAVILNVSSNESEKLLKSLTLNGCWCTIPENNDQMRFLIMNCLDSFKLGKDENEESEEYKLLKEVYEILFPNEFQKGTVTIPLTDVVGESLISGRAKEKILVFVDSKEERKESKDGKKITQSNKR